MNIRFRRLTAVGLAVALAVAGVGAAVTPDLMVNSVPTDTALMVNSAPTQPDLQFADFLDTAPTQPDLQFATVQTNPELMVS